MIEFISGLMTGGLFGILLMCLLQIYRDNEAQRRIDKAIEYLKTATIDPQSILHYRGCLLEILGGDVDEN